MSAGQPPSGRRSATVWDSGRKTARSSSGEWIGEAPVYPVILDVLIVGAGPAGSVAATVLARAGARVCIVDRARFPRDKLCGDTINPGTLARLRRLNLTDLIERRGLRVDGMRVSG